MERNELNDLLTINAELLKCVMFYSDELSWEISEGRFSSIIIEDLELLPHETEHVTAHRFKGGRQARECLGEVYRIAGKYDNTTLQ